MSELIVSKAGGTSHATPEAFQQTLEWVDECAVMVVSAPGKIEGIGGFEGAKVTDLLLGADALTRDPQAVTEFSATHNAEDHMKVVQARFADLAYHLEAGMPRDWASRIPDRIRGAIDQSTHAVSALGERLTAEVYRGLGYPLIEFTTAPKGLGSNMKLWREWAPTVYSPSSGPHIMQGNTTIDQNGRISTFSRGGSDTAAGYLSYGLQADLHRNLTDGPAKSADPRKITDPSKLRLVEHALYAELAELGANGTGLLHHHAAVPLMVGDIPTEIRSTFDRNSGITRLDNDSERAKIRAGKALAISVMNEICIVRVYEPGMSIAYGRLDAFDSGIAIAGIPLVDAQGDGAEAHQYFMHKDHAQSAAEIIREKVVNNGEVTVSEPVDFLAVVGYRIGDRFAHHINSLLIDSAYDPEEQRSLGLSYPPTASSHVLRVCVPQARTDETLNNLHRSLVEC